MEDMKLGVVESKFADIIWANEPLPSRRLVELCQAELNWKKPTTYTVLRKLCERGLFQNIDGTVSSVISREEFNTLQSRHFVEETFDRSLPAFLAAFMGGKTISDAEAEELKAVIDRFRKEG